MEELTPKKETFYHFETSEALRLLTSKFGLYTKLVLL
jgi:hypothetical protein